MSEKNAPRTIIGPFTVVNGEIQSKQDLVIQGRVDGSLQVDAVLFIEAGAVVEAAVKANHAVVAGTFQGDLEADVLEVAQTGRVMGRVKAPRMVIADGAIVNAEIHMSGGFAPAAEVEEAAAAPLATTSTRRSVYSYTLPTAEKAPAPAPAPVEDDNEIDEDLEVVAKAEVTTPAADKGGKKKKS
ncbi:MAG: polymer-forming cytoskeletal protein [Pseudomonadota bacterium]